MSGASDQRQLGLESECETKGKGSEVKRGDHWLIYTAHVGGKEDEDKVRCESAVVIIAPSLFT